MTSWNDFMQGMHSSLIDELNERYPKEKPTLGLPRRFSGWTLLEEATQAAHLPVELENALGVCMISGGLSQTEKELLELLFAVVQRARAEFERKRIEPRFMTPVFSPRKERPRSLKDPALLIQFPIRIRPERTDTLIFDLGIGI